MTRAAEDALERQTGHRPWAAIKAERGVAAMDKLAGDALADIRKRDVEEWPVIERLLHQRRQYAPSAPDDDGWVAAEDRHRLLAALSPSAGRDGLDVKRLTTVLYDWVPDGADVSVGFDGAEAHLTGADLARFIFERAAEYAALSENPEAKS